MGVSELRFLGGVSLTFLQTADLIERFCHQEGSYCAKVRENYPNLKKYPMIDILIRMRDSSTSIITDEKDLDDTMDAYYDFMRALEKDVKKVDDLSFQRTHHDIYENEDVAGVLGIEFDTMTFGTMSCNWNSAFKRKEFDRKVELVRNLTSLLGAELTKQLMTDVYGTYASGDDCMCCT